MWGLTEDQIAQFGLTFGVGAGFALGADSVAPGAACMRSVSRTVKKGSNASSE